MENKDRHKIIIIFVILGALLLTFRSAQLQLFTQKYKEQAARTTLYKSIIYPARGLLYDRNGKPLVLNYPIYEILAIKNKVNPAMDTANFCRLLNIDIETFKKNLDKDWSNPKFHKAIPFVFLNKISPEQFAVFQEHMYKFPGFYPVQRYIRAYPHQHAAHALGYMGEVNKEIIEKYGDKYAAGDFIGISGIEYAYENELSGEKGVQYILRDNLGRMVGSFDNGRLDSMAVSGEDIDLSIDIDLQAYGESLLKNKRGAIVAIEPSTGQILALVSSPSFDPNLLTLDEKRGKGIKLLLLDSINKPLNNRAVTKKYPPGSIFKPILSLITLQKGTTYASKTIYCPGYYRLSATKVQKCHGHSVPKDISEAIQHSCNTYFFQLYRDFVDQYGYKKPGVGLDTLVSYLYDFGLGKRLGVDLSYENKGYVPTSEYYNRLYRKEVNGWRSVWTLSLGIGQGEMQLTTIQMANLAVILANRGFYYTPHLIKQFRSGKPLPIEYSIPKKVRIDKKHFAPVIDGLEKVVLYAARSAYVPGLDVCGKTGTSENVHGEDHSVFFGFAPKNKPRIAIAVFVENAGFGAEWAAPVAGLMIEKYLNKEISPARKYLEESMIKGILVDNQVEYIVPEEQ
ncbi:MAG: penicillin-binding protein 2 [Saprospiraceae bacterium]|nr:penicillin-binding protein 2 [Saprospiraceae bacterium]